jgi:hypothetical protein
MMVFGDRQRVLPLGCVLDNLQALCSSAASTTADRQREVCTRLLLEAGSCTQALLDIEHARRGADHAGPFEAQCLQLCRHCAHGLLVALGERPKNGAWLAAAQRSVRALSIAPATTALTLREPEGYAYYSLYPEQYVRAAYACAQRHADAPWCVVGIRSIGTSLAAIVSEVLDAEIFHTVRPVGHPYARELRIDAELEASLLQHTSCARYAIVDEGPGRSGSSFAALFRWLVAHAIEPERIVFFPSHPGEPGPHADPEFRAVYARATRHHVGFEDSVATRTSIGAWFGPGLQASQRRAPMELSGGRWRALLYAHEDRYPASYICTEARKFLITTEHGDWLLKQIGLGESARACTEQKRVLGEQGLCPELRDAYHGFVLLRWHTAARPLDDYEVERELLIRTLSSYLSFLARHFPASAYAGARPGQLLQMVDANAHELLGGSCALEDGLASLAARLPHLEASHRPIVSDNKLDKHEWVYLPEGRILKSDSRAHDLIGCQDLAWDTAGAKVELELTESELEQLLSRLYDGARVSLCSVRLRFYETAYLAFRAGQAQLAYDTLRTRWPDEAVRMAHKRSRYVEQLRALFV